AGGADALPRSAPTAKTDNCFCSRLRGQLGHCGASPSRVRNSNRRPQARHSYSKRGMTYILSHDMPSVVAAVMPAPRAPIELREFAEPTLEAGSAPTCDVRRVRCDVRRRAKSAFVVSKSRGGRMRVRMLGLCWLLLGAAACTPPPEPSAATRPTIT